MKPIEVILLLVGCLFALGIVWKMLGALSNVVLSGSDRKMRESPLGLAVLAVADEGGFNDGSPRARQVAIAAFEELAENSPIELSLPRWKLTETANQHALETTTSKYPIWVNAAYEVTLLMPENELEWWNTNDPHTVVMLMGHFTALFPSWLKDHQTGSLTQLRLTKVRLAMIMMLLGDEAKRSGLL